jgi:hypothetical protein
LYSEPECGDKDPGFLLIEGEAKEVIALADNVREESKQAIAKLKGMETTPTSRVAIIGPARARPVSRPPLGPAFWMSPGSVIEATQAGSLKVSDKSLDTTPKQE